MAITTENRTVLNATRARSGRLGRDVFWVLVFSTLLAALALFAAWTWKSGDLSETRGRAPASAAQTFDSVEPAPATQQTP